MTQLVRNAPVEAVARAPTRYCHNWLFRIGSGPQRECVAFVKGHWNAKHHHTVFFDSVEKQTNRFIRGKAEFSARDSRSKLRIFSESGQTNWKLVYPLRKICPDLKEQLRVAVSFHALFRCYGSVGAEKQRSHREIDNIRPFEKRGKEAGLFGDG